MPKPIAALWLAVAVAFAVAVAGCSALPDVGGVRSLVTVEFHGGMSDEQREVFLLREYHGISFKEIADVTGVNENTVKSRMRYALEGLRKRLSELGVDGEMVTDGRTVA